MSVIHTELGIAFLRRLEPAPHTRYKVYYSIVKCICSILRELAMQLLNELPQFCHISQSNNSTLYILSDDLDNLPSNMIKSKQGCYQLKNLLFCLFNRRRYYLIKIAIAPNVEIHKFYFSSILGRIISYLLLNIKKYVK